MGYPLQGSGFGGSGGDPNNLGYFATQLALQAAYPTSTAGKYATVGSTNTIWIWDVGTTAWIDSGNAGQVTSIITTNGGTETGSVSVTTTKINAVPTSRTINSKALTGDIVLTKDDIDATIVDTTDLTAALASYVPTSRTINGQALTSNVTITIPTALASLTQDTTHRTVSDVQINSWDSKQDALGYTAENVTNKGIANGYTPLGADGKIPSAYIGQIAITTVYVQEAEPATLVEGVVWVQPSSGISKIYDDAYGWATIGNVAGYVTDVNGKSGPSVTLTKSDIGLSNVTNNSQVIATGGRTSGNIPTFSSTDGTTLGNGYTVVNTISETPTTTALPSEKAVKDAISGITITLDSEVASTSTNGVENQAIWYNLEGGNGHPGKVDKVAGKVLSSNDYTSTEKTKLSGIADGAEVNVQSDWNVTDSLSDAYILNKPHKPSETASGLVPPVTGSDVNKYLHSKSDGTGLEWVTVSTGAITATQVAYDPATSGLSATNAQSAIDELANEKLNKALTQGYSFVGNSSNEATQMQVATLPTWQNSKYLKSTTTPGVLEFADGGSGSSTFLDLTDTPDSYSGQTLKYVRVNAEETALEFVTAPSSTATWGSITGTLALQTDLQSALDGKLSTSGKAADSDLWDGLHVPATTGNASKVLALNSTATAFEFVTAASSQVQYVYRSLEGSVYETTFLYWVAPATCTIAETKMHLGTNPTASGSYCKIQIMKNGLLETNSIFTSDSPMQITELTSATNSIYTASGTLDSGQTTLAAGDVIQFRVNQADTGSSDLTVQMKVTY